MSTSYPRKFFSLFIIILFLESCSLFSEPPSNDVFFGGEIVNAKSKEIVISYQSDPIDTIKLDRDNRFYAYIMNVKPGLYSFRNGSESQNMFLEPGDSTVVYVNSRDFDETLNFSGRGAAKNNFLIETYLLNEKNNDLVLFKASLDPKSFAVLTDSIKNARKIKLENLEDKYDFSPEFMDLANTSINFEHFDMKERYTYMVNKYNHNYISEFPDDFHEYRKSIDFNNSNYQNYYGYLRFVDNYLINKSIEDCHHDKNNNYDKCGNVYSFRNIKRRLELIDSLTDNKDLINVYYNKLGAQAIFSSTSTSQLDSIMQLLQTVKLPKDKLRNLWVIATVQNVYMPGNIVPNIDLLNTKKEKIPLSEIISGPTVFYNWSIHDKKHYSETQEIIKTLRKKYPQINFIGLNIDAEEVTPWLKTIKENKYKSDEEYQLTDISIDKNLLNYFLDKLLLVDSSGKVIMGDIKLTTPEFEARIEQFLAPDRKDFIYIKN